MIVKASDADKVLTDDDKINGYSDIRYTLRGENSNLFTIDSITGVIQVNNICITLTNLDKTMASKTCEFI